MVKIIAARGGTSWVNLTYQVVKDDQFKCMLNKPLYVFLDEKNCFFTFREVERNENVSNLAGR